MSTCSELMLLEGTCLVQEACFLGSGDALVACGSDDGKVYIYDASTGMPVKVLSADQVRL